jgi:hypothetical protein
MKFDVLPLFMVVVFFVEEQWMMDDEMDDSVVILISFTFVGFFLLHLFACPSLETKYLSFHYHTKET